METLQANHTPANDEVKSPSLADRLLAAVLKPSKLDPLAQQNAQLRFYGFSEGDSVCFEANSSRGSQLARKAQYPLTTEVLSMDYRGVYVHPEPIQQVVFSRFAPEFANLLKRQGVDGKDVSSYRTIKFDVDQDDRKHDISATDNEHRGSARVAIKLLLFLIELTGKKNACCILDSGNGYHIHLRVDLPNDEDSKKLIQRLFNVFGYLVNEKGFKLDESLWKPNSMVPLASTWKRKGDNDKEAGRIHRVTQFFGNVKQPVDVLTVNEVKALLTAAEARLTPEQAGFCQQKQGIGSAPGKRGRPTNEEKEAPFWDACNALSMLEVCREVGFSTDPAVCPICDRAIDGDFPYRSEKIPVDLLHCFHDTCGQLNLNNVGLVAHALCKVTSLKGNKEAVKTVAAWFRAHFPGLPEFTRKSANDKKAEKFERFREQVKATQEAKKSLAPLPDGTKAEESDSDKKRFSQHDVGNARRMIALYGINLRWCSTMDTWLVWNGSRWVEDCGNDLIYGYAHRLVDLLEVEAAECTDVDEGWQLAEHAKTSGHNARIKGMLEQARGIPGVSIKAEALNKDPWLLNCPNGTLELKTGTLREHRREDLLSYMTGVSVELHGKCPMFDTFMAEVQPDPAVRDWILKFDGYSITGAILQHLFPTHLGKGRNGKGVHQKLMLRIMGDYADAVNPKLLISSKQSSDKLEQYQASLLHKRMIFASETEKNVHMNVAVVKSLTGDDTLKAKLLYRDEFSMDPTHKVQLNSQHKLKVNEQTDAIWERVVLIPWEQQFLKGKGQKLTLIEDIYNAEAPAILGLLVRYCLRWQEEGLDLPEAIQTASDAYKKEEDTIGRWLDDTCQLHPQGKTGATDAYQSYSSWCSCNGFNALNSTNFGSELTDRFKKAQDEKGRNMYFGLVINDGRASPANDSIQSEKYLRNNSLTDSDIQRIIDETQSEPQPSEGFEPRSPEAPEALSKVPLGNRIINGFQQGRTPQEELNSDPLKGLSDSPSGASGALRGRAVRAEFTGLSLYVYLILEDGREALQISTAVESTAELHGIPVPAVGRDPVTVDGSEMIISYKVGGGGVLLITEARRAA